MNTVKVISFDIKLMEEYKNEWQEFITKKDLSNFSDYTQQLLKDYKIGYLRREQPTIIGGTDKDRFYFYVELISETEGCIPIKGEISKNVIFQIPIFVTEDDKKILMDLFSEYSLLSKLEKLEATKTETVS